MRVEGDSAHHPRSGASPRKNHPPSHIGEEMGCRDGQRQYLLCGEALNCPVGLYWDAVEGGEPRVQHGCLFGDASKLAPT